MTGNVSLNPALTGGEITGVYSYIPPSHNLGVPWTPPWPVQNTPLNASVSNNCFLYDTTGHPMPFPGGVPFGNDRIIIGDRWTPDYGYGVQWSASNRDLPPHGLRYFNLGYIDGHVEAYRGGIVYDRWMIFMSNGGDNMSNWGIAAFLEVVGR